MATARSRIQASSTAHVTWLSEQLAGMDAEIQAAIEFSPAWQTAADQFHVFGVGPTTPFKREQLRLWFVSMKHTKAPPRAVKFSML